MEMFCSILIYSCFMKLDDFKIIFFVLALVVQFIGVLISEKENFNKRSFLISSLIITSLLVFVLVIKIHHLLRSEINIPNTVTYGIILLPITVHFLKFKQIVLNNNFIILLLSLITILIALILDLLTDARIIQFVGSNSIEELFRIIGSALWFVYYLFYVSKNTRVYGT